MRAPLPKPLRGIFCVGRNYRAHAAELADSVFSASLPAEDAWPIVFTKLAECVVGPHDPVRLPGAAVTTQIDYESELAVVIGRGGRDIQRARAMDHVFGYTIVNDVSARDVQVRHQQWDLGKSFDTFCPMGPWITTADELDGRSTRVSGWVNGELRQDGRAGLKADEADSGAVTLIQRFGSAANLNIHLHCLVLDGVYRCGADGAPVFVEASAPTDEALQAVLHKVMTRMMKLPTRRGGVGRRGGFDLHG